MKKFSDGVHSQIDYYVYLLKHPKEYKPFYVGKGKGDRVFAHVNDTLPKEEEISAKMEKIRAIKGAGYEVEHVILRHGMDENTALEVESCLIDYIPGLTNEMSGIGVNRGPATAQEIDQFYAAEPMVLDEDHRLLFILIKDRTLQETKSVYTAVRGHWKLGKKRAEAVEYVLAMNRNICVGVFRPDLWYPSKQAGEEDRLGFCGREILSGPVFERYRDKKWPECKEKWPDGFRKTGARNPVKYYPER